MPEDMDIRLQLHEKWLDSIRREGEQLAMYGVDFRNFDFTGKNMEEVYLNDCMFDGLRLRNIDFQTSHLCLSSYRNADLIGCNFYWADLAYSHFENASLKRVRFAKSDCTEVNFTNADIISCRFAEANLFQANFHNARLEDVNIKGTKFNETILNGVSMKKITGFDKAIFKSINIGTAEEPVILEGEQAREWVRERCL